MNWESFENSQSAVIKCLDSVYVPGQHKIYVQARYQISMHKSNWIIFVHVLRLKSAERVTQSYVRMIPYFETFCNSIVVKVGQMETVQIVALLSKVQFLFQLFLDLNLSRAKTGVDQDALMNDYKAMSTLHRSARRVLFLAKDPLIAETRVNPEADSNKMRSR